MVHPRQIIGLLDYLDVVGTKKVPALAKREKPASAGFSLLERWLLSV